MLLVTFADICYLSGFVHCSRMILDNVVGRGTSLTIAASLSGRLLNYSVHQLRPHPSYARHKLSVQASQLAALEEYGELALRIPVIVTRECFIIDGYARWEFAKCRARYVPNRQFLSIPFRSQLIHSAA
jgi:hypothetical protein